MSTKAEKDAAILSEKRNRNTTSMIADMPKMNEQAAFVDWRDALSDLSYNKEWLEDGQTQDNEEYWTPLDMETEANEP